MNDKNVDSETRELIDSFIAESNDLLDDVESKMNSLDKDGDIEPVNTVFRAFHSIKGTAGYLNFKNISSITHIAETLLDVFRKENIKPTQVEIDILYLTCDILRKLLENVQKEFDDNAYDDESKIVAGSIQKLIDHYKNQKDSKEGKNKKAEKNEAKKKENEFEELVTDEIIEQ